MTLPAELDDWVDTLATAVGVPAGRDPDTIFPPCIYVELPPVAAATLPSMTLDMPVWLLSAGLGKAATDATLELLPALLAETHSRTADPGSIAIGGQEFHGYRVTAQIIVDLPANP